MKYLRSVKNTIKEDILNKNIIMCQLYLTKNKKINTYYCTRKQCENVSGPYGDKDIISHYNLPNHNFEVNKNIKLSNT